MENNITVNLENLSQSERDTLMSIIEKANAPKSKVWKPKHEENYFRINGIGKIELCCNRTQNITDDSFSIGNCFRTREEAEFARERLKVLAELRRYAEEHNEREIYWNGKNASYIIAFDHGINKVSVDYFYGTQYQGCIYFTSSNLAKAAIKEIGEDRIKKYLFNIET